MIQSDLRVKPRNALLGEIAFGASIRSSWKAWLSLAYIAVFPSFIAYLFFNRGIELIGAARAGQSMHLMPVFGSVMALLFLGESFRLYHAVGISLIAAGIRGSFVVCSGIASRTFRSPTVRTPTTAEVFPGLSS